MTIRTAATATTAAKSCSTAQHVTKSLLGYGVLAGAVFEISILIQGLTRHGFRLAHDASLLSNGPLGWIQITTFLVSGAMTIAFAAGARCALAGHAGRKWGPRLIAVYGAGIDEQHASLAVHDNGVALAELALVDQHTLRDLPQHGWLLPVVGCLCFIDLRSGLAG